MQFLFVIHHRDSSFPKEKGKKKKEKEDHWKRT